MAEGGELVPAISITDSGSTPTVNSPADLATPPSRARSHSSPRKETESIGTSSTTTRLRENLEGPDAKRSDSPFRSTVQDRLLNLLLSQVIPTEDSSSSDHGDKPSRTYVDRPGFSLPLMSNNFRRFNARVGVLFVLQNRLIRLFTWQTPSHTLSFLALYTFICLDPYLLAVVPLAISIFYIMIPSFLARHPPPPTPTPNALLESSSLGGPPLAPAPKIKPAPDLSKDFFRNMRDLQNSMEDFSRAHDFTVSRILPPFTFSDERLSSAAFAALTFSCAALFIAARHLPWRAIALAAGWAAVAAQHPAVQAALARDPATALAMRREEARAAGRFRAFAVADVLLDPEAERREVEVFEVQRLAPESGAAEWEAHCFAPTPWDPLSPARLAGERGPRGARFFEDVRPPRGWRWADKKWTLDLMAKEWVAERMITGVEVEMEGERWVSDVVYEQSDDQVSVERKKGRGRVSFESTTQRHKLGEWRRRRWVRLVERIAILMDGKDEKG